MLRRVAGLSKALAELGIKSGDRVGIFAPNCPEWHVADFAIKDWGRSTCRSISTSPWTGSIYILNDSGARIVITTGEAQARKIAEVPRPHARAGARDFAWRRRMICTAKSCDTRL